MVLDGEFADEYGVYRAGAYILEGTFQDEYGDVPIGTWVRSPHMTSHQPYSEPRCLIFVKVVHLL